MSRRFSTAFVTDLRFASSGRARTEVARGSTLPSIDEASTGRFAVFTPTGYEPNYAYPLLVWFHDEGEGERVVHRLLPQVSDRNVVGLAMRGESSFGRGFDWAPRSASREQRLASTVRHLRRRHHIHSERIILAGRGSGAVAAAELFFSRPDWFGGLALFDAAPSACSTPLRADEELAGKPVLLDLPLELLGRGRESAGRLTAAGLDATVRHSRLGPPDGESLRYLNRWLMAAVCGVNG